MSKIPEKRAARESAARESAARESAAREAVTREERTHKTVRNIMDRLVGIQSDTGTAMECDIAQEMEKIFAEDEYFAAHPESFGLEDTGDPLGRPAVWALKRGKSGSTIVLTGHYDAVEIDSYGELREAALMPDLLKAELKKRKMGDEKVREHLADEDWVFGRGTADMKGGLAMGMCKTLEGSPDGEASILFLAVCDEENLSAGARSSVDFLLRLRERFLLEYKAILILEPQLSLGGESFLVYDGSIGKMMPLLVAKGKPAHCGEPLKGLNSAHLMAEMVSQINLSTELVTEDKGLSTQVPMVQMMRDLKETYDVSLPEYSAACFNLLFLGSDSSEKLLERIGALAEAGCKVFMEKYSKACRAALQKGLIGERDMVKGGATVVDIKGLEALVERYGADLQTVKEGALTEATQRLQSGELNMVEAGVLYVKRLLSCVEADGAVVVLGLCPPYYPPVNNDFFDGEREGKGERDEHGGDGGRRGECVLRAKYVSAVEGVLRGRSLVLKLMPYFTGIGDGSYLSPCDAAKERRVLDKMILPRSVYDVPLEKSGLLGAPCFYLGPRGEDIHKWSERVYMPDLEETVPRIIDEIAAAACGSGYSR